MEVQFMGVVEAQELFCVLGTTTGGAYAQLLDDTGFDNTCADWLGTVDDFKRGWDYVEARWEVVKKGLTDLAKTDPEARCLPLIVQSPGVLINAMLDKLVEAMEAGQGLDDLPPLSPDDLDPRRERCSQAPDAPAPWLWSPGGLAMAVLDHTSGHRRLPTFEVPAILTRARQQLAQAGLNLQLLDRLAKVIWPICISTEEICELCAEL